MDGSHVNALRARIAGNLPRDSPLATFPLSFGGEQSRNYEGSPQYMWHSECICERMTRHCGVQVIV